MKKSILCLGNPVFDTFASVSDDILVSNNIEKGSAPILDPKKVIEIISKVNFISANCGGSASNIAKGIALVGGKAGLFGQYADDKEGDIIKDSLKEHGVIDHCSVEKGGITTQINCLVTPDAQRTMIPLFGASHFMNPEAVDYSVVDNYDYFLLEGYQFCNQCLVDISYAFLDRVKEKNISLILSISNIFCVESYYQHMKHFAEAARMIVGNEEEFLKLFNFDDVNKLLDHLQSQCVKGGKYEMIMVTAGPKGANILWEGKRFFVEAPDVKTPVDTTGAGDYFVAGLLYGYFQGYDMSISNKIAQIMAKDIISKFGSTLSPSVVDEVKKVLP
ncbi:pfkB family kinase [Mycoplasma haemofelis str. Langford 1]|uniref:PfkB kinase family protein n=2 Tax=Mycoplasma haemofelis TaxID=29501 RepID=F6FHF0_MYCHI|nr:adenosine kinase [Mycoplasma haemofelis]AEG73780.1 pfkB kinase family protein [Mycoplasma haemofelis Ohio2]CBY93485.1 pfkB family kinase [Mycoplasma haemofelis str. Langford 1]